MDRNQVCVNCGTRGHPPILCPYRYGNPIDEQSPGTHHPLEVITCAFCKKVGHVVADCPASLHVQIREKERHLQHITGRCLFCDQQGHMKDTCSIYHTKLTAAITVRTQSLDPVWCRICGQLGHRELLHQDQFGAPDNLAAPNAPTPQP